MAQGRGRNSGEEFVRNLEKKELWCYNNLNMKPEFVREENEPVSIRCWYVRESQKQRLRRPERLKVG